MKPERGLQTMFWDNYCSGILGLANHEMPEMCEGHFLCTGIANAPNINGKGRPFSNQSHPKRPLGTQGAPKGPTGIQREPMGVQSDPRESPLGAQGAPKGPNRKPKVIPREQNEFQRHPKETNKSQNYIHINKIHANSRSPPYSGRLVLTTDSYDYY